MDTNAVGKQKCVSICKIGYIIFWSFLLANIKVWRERVIFGESIVCVPLRLVRNCPS